MSIASSSRADISEPAGGGHEPVGGPSGTQSQGPHLDEEYGDIHKIVLQGLLAAGFLDTKGVKKLFIGACTYLKLDHAERTTMPYVQRIVREINDQIKTYDMAIKSASCEFTGRKFYIFLITVENTIFKFQTLFTKFELELFQKCMDCVLRKYNNFSVPLTECMNFAKECEAKGSLQEAESFILRMIRTKYFAKFMLNDTEFNVTMGFRGLREFEPMLKELYNDVISNCNLCKMVLLHGLLCPNCRTHFHKHCYTKFFRTSKECPHCKIPWTKSGAKEEPIEMIWRLRETETNVQTPASHEEQRVAGEEESQDQELLEGAVGVGGAGTRPEAVEEGEEVEFDEAELELESEEEEEEDGYGAEGDSDEEGGDDEELEGVGEYEVGEEVDDGGEGVEDNVEYEGEGEELEEVENEDDEEQEEDVQDEEENEEDEEDEQEEVEASMKPPPTPSIRRSTRVSQRSHPQSGPNLSESDSD